MSLVKNIEVGGCRESWSTLTFVDLSEPDRIGQCPLVNEQVCTRSPLYATIPLEVVSTGKVITSNNGTEHAEVLIYCRAAQCPLNKDYQININV